MSEPRTWSGHVFIAMSVDGYIAGPDGNLDWLIDPPPEHGHVPAHSGDDAPAGYEDFTADVTHLVMGRGTYETVLSFDPWPYGRFRTVVLSTTLAPDADERIAVATSIGQVASLLDTEQAGKVYLDGGQAITAFLVADLVDELTITRAPVILGAGLPLFRALSHPVRLVHRGTSTTETGMTTTRYRVNPTGDR